MKQTLKKHGLDNMIKKIFISVLTTISVFAFAGGEQSGGGGSNEPIISTHDAKTQQSEVRAIAYNIEGGYKSDANIDTIVGNMRSLGKADIWAFSEATLRWREKLTKAAGDNYIAVSTNGATDTTDTLMLVVNANRFDLLSHKELTNINIHQYSRPPLEATLRDKSTGQVFKIMVNHLERKNKQGRHKQAAMLNAYIKTIDQPFVAMGDYNFDWDLNQGSNYRDKGYDLLTENNIVSWVKPTHMIKTSCAKAFNSILDFAFVNSLVKSSRSDILLREKHYCEDDELKPDHRPIEMVFAP